MTDQQLAQMNAQATLIAEALREAITEMLRQHPDIPHGVAMTSLIDVAVSSAKLAGMPLALLIQRATAVYDAG